MAMTVSAGLRGGLVDEAFHVQDKFAPDRIIPIRREHLIDPADGLSNAFSLALLGSVKHVGS